MQSLATGKMVVKDEKQRIVYGEVYSPFRLDTDGETMTQEDIGIMAQRFMEDHLVSKIDVEHDEVESGAEVIRSFIAMKNDPDGFVAGSWVLGVKVHPDPLWEKVMKGELNGFSFSGSVDRVPAEAVVQMVVRAYGDTEKSEDGPLPPHIHKCDISFDGNGRVLPGQFTDWSLDHQHPIEKATATGSEIDHGHRLVLI